MSIRIMVVAMMLATAAALAMIAYQVVTPMTPAAIQQAAREAPAPLTVSYIAAARPLPTGTLARDEDFTTRAVPQAQVPLNAIIDTQANRIDLRGALVRRYLETGAPVTVEDMLRPRDRGFIASVLSPNTRAVSIGVDAVSGVAGLIWPGDRVDVILTQEMDKGTASAARRVLSETILTNVRVIAVDQEMVQGASATAGVGGRVARTVTIEVNADQAERITVGQRLGTLALAIRSADDQGRRLSPTATVFGGDVSPALGGVQEETRQRMQIIEGEKRIEVTFP